MLVSGLTCVAPTLKTYGHEAGKLGLNFPESPSLYEPSESGRGR